MSNSLNRNVSTEKQLDDISVESTESAVQRFELLKHIIMKAAVDIAIKQYIELEERKKNDVQYGPQRT